MLIDFSNHLALYRKGVKGGVRKKVQVFLAGSLTENYEKAFSQSLYDRAIELSEGYPYKSHEWKFGMYRNEHRNGYRPNRWLKTKRKKIFLKSVDLKETIATISSDANPTIKFDGVIHYTIEVHAGDSVWLFPDSRTIDVTYDIFDHSPLEDLFLALYASEV